MIRSAFLAILLFGPYHGHARGADPPGAHHRMRCDRSRNLVVDHFVSERRVGQDRVPVEALDLTTLRFDPELAAVVISCQGGKRCIVRESFREAIVRRSSRYVLELPPDDPTGQQTMHILRQLMAEMALGHTTM